MNYAKNCKKSILYIKYNQKNKKIYIISFTYTTANPRTMMIKSDYTIIAITAMMRPERFHNITS